MLRPSAADKRRTFRKLHESGCFVIPNPWDVGSARTLVHLGFPALATTSAGFAWSVGRADNHIALDRYVTPDEFKALRDEGMAMGFKHVESGPLVRSSYHAWEQVQAASLT